MEFFFFKKIIIAKFCLKQMRTMKKFELKNLYNARVTIISIFVSENENIFVSCIAYYSVRISDERHSVFTPLHGSCLWRAAPLGM